MSIARNLSQLADNINVSGILSTTGGGTGTATPALVAGTNITVSGTWPNQTINSTASGGVTSVAALTLGTTGTDVTSTVATGTTTPVITLNIPTASASSRGVLSTADWTTFNSKQAALGFTSENAANKGAANGYAPLDATSKISATYLPSYVDDVLEYANLAAFPATGETGKIYITVDDNKTYRWSGTVYIVITASPGSTDSITEGSTNLYFTNIRARAAISATQNITYNSTTGVITGPVLTGYLTTESDTLATVTARGATSSTAVTFSGGITGNLTGNASGLSSVLAVASGGTGTATPGLVAGTNITVTGTWPNQTVNSTATGSGGGTSTASSATYTRTAFTATNGQTDFTVAYTVGYVEVYLNGLLLPTVDYTATSGTSITLGVGCIAGDIVETKVYTLVIATGFITRVFTGTGSQATFAITSGITVDTVLVTENGVVQTPTTDYTVSGTTLTFVTAPASGVVIQIRELSGSGGSSSAESISPFMLMGA